MKRKLTLFLSAVMATSCLPMTAYAANFKDINDVPWAAATINSVADKGLLSGYEDGTFRGKNNVTYCEAMQMVYTTMTKSGAASMDAVSVFGYMQALDTMKVPKWAQMAVAYGLSEGILDMQMVATKFAGGKTAATREDVAIIFGNAVGKVFGKEKDTSAAKYFADYWNISVNALEQVHLLKKMEIISGDNYKKFNPKQNITRAEMAVMLNKTYDTFNNGINVTGVIEDLVTNKGADGTSYYFLEVKLTDGGRESFKVAEGEIPVYAGDTNEKISMSKLSVGDDVVIAYSGTELLSIRQTKATPAQKKYDVTGYLTSYKNGKLYLENENTWDTTEYKMADGTYCYVNGESINKNKIDDILKENYKDYAYAGLITEVKREKIGGIYQDVTYVKELHITFVQEYSVAGQVVKYSPEAITVKLAEDSLNKNFLLEKDCKLYLDGKESTYSELKKLVDTGTMYVKMVLNTADIAVSVTMSRDSFVETQVKDQDTTKTYEATALTDKKLVLYDGNEKITYNFASTAALDNVRFYTWTAYNETWDAVGFADAKDYADAEKLPDKNGDLKDVNKIYARVGFNSGGKLSEVYLSNIRTAWKTSDEAKVEREGAVASIVNDVLKFEGSSTAFTLLRKYEGSDLLINGGSANSKTMLSKMANDDGIGLYAEITANGENEITKITARPTSAVGKIVKWTRDEKVLEIETEDGNTFKLATQRKPILTDAEKLDLTIDDLESVTYRGEWVKLDFTDSGVVEKFTLVNGPKDVDITDRVSGIATAADSGLKVDGKVYPWYGKTSEIEVVNLSTPQQSLSVVKTLIEDPDVEVYVEATLNDDGKVISIKVYVKEAEGELTAAGTSIRIETESGNKFAFNRKAKLTVCDINGWDQTDLEEFDRGIGENVLLTFSDRGEVVEITDK